MEGPVSIATLFQGEYSRDKIKKKIIESLGGDEALNSKYIHHIFTESETVNMDAALDIFNSGVNALNKVSRKSTDDQRKFLWTMNPESKEKSLYSQYINVFLYAMFVHLQYFAVLAPDYEDKLLDIIEQKAKDFTESRNKRTKAPATIEANYTRTLVPVASSYIMQGESLNMLFYNAMPADMPLLFFILSDKVNYNRDNGWITAALDDYLSLTGKENTRKTCRNIGESLERIGDTKFRTYVDDGKNRKYESYPFGAGTKVRVGSKSDIHFQVSEMAREIFEKCRLQLPVPDFLYKLQPKDSYTFKMWYKLEQNTHVNMGKDELVTTQKEKERLKKREGCISIKSVCNYIGLETELKEKKRFNERLRAPFNKSLQILAENGAIEYWFSYSGENTPITDYNSLSYDNWLLLNLHYDIIISPKALEARKKALLEKKQAILHKEKKKAKQQISDKAKKTVSQQKQTPEPEKVFTNVTQGLFDENDE